MAGPVGSAWAWPLVRLGLPVGLGRRLPGRGLPLATLTASLAMSHDLTNEAIAWLSSLGKGSSGLEASLAR